MEKLPPKANLRIKEVADFLDLSISSVYDMINGRVLPSVSVNNGRRGGKRIPRIEFEAWYKSRIQAAD